jgi:A/G-specific adenine glycosylase
MLQQTRVETVIPYFERFLSAFPTVRDLAAAPEDRVFKRWEGLGYYSRVRNLHAAAKLVVSERGGEFPRDSATWQTLPGVGRYTAGAISSIVFGERVAALDGNLKRVLARLFAVEEPIDSTATTAALWNIATELLPLRGAGELNQALMDLGAGPCAVARPQCLACPLRRHCAAYERGIQDRIPVRRAKAAIPLVRTACVASVHAGRILLTKRSGRGLLTGLWQLPMCDSDTQVRLPAELARSLKISADKCQLLGVVTHIFTHRRMELSVYATTAKPSVPSASASVTYELVPTDSLGDYAFSALFQKALRLVFPAGESHSLAR